LLAVDLDARPASARALLELPPQISVHRARMRLGELVPAELGALPTGEAAVPLRASNAPVETRTHAPAPAQAQGVSAAPAEAAGAGGLASEPPPARLGKGPRRALAVAGLSLLALISAVGVRALTRSERQATVDTA